MDIASVSPLAARPPGRPMQTFLTAKEICTALNISKATLYRLIAAGDFARPVKIGSVSRWPAAALERFVAQVKKEVA